MKKYNKIQKKVLFVLFSFSFLFLFTLPCISSATQIPLGINLLVTSGTVSSAALGIDTSIDATINLTGVILGYSNLSIDYDSDNTFKFNGKHNFINFQEAGTYSCNNVGTGPINISTTLLASPGVIGGVSFFYDGTSVLLNNPHIGGVARFDAVPIPAASWLLGSGLIGLFGIRRKIFS